MLDYIMHLRTTNKARSVIRLVLKNEHIHIQTYDFNVFSAIRWLAS